VFFRPVCFLACRAPEFRNKATVICRRDVAALSWWHRRRSSVYNSYCSVPVSSRRYCGIYSILLPIYTVAALAEAVDKY
jgi:hypothetical protein